MLSDCETRALLQLPVHVRELSAGQAIVREGDRPAQCGLLLSGFACRYKMVGDGQRQILSFHIPGDMPDLMSLYLSVMDHNLGTLTSCRVAFIAHGAILGLVRDYPRIAAALWCDTLNDTAMLRQWLVVAGRLSGYARTAHLICEMVTRLRAAGLAAGDSVEMPVTQSVLADALGLSAVHVNRVTQELRAAGLIDWRGKTLTVTNWAGLVQAADFDPAYLRLPAG